MKRGWQAASLGFLALFVFAIWKATSLPFRDALGPGPGFFPFWLGAIGATLAVLLILEVTRSRELATPVADLVPDRAATFRIAAVLALLVAAAFAFEPIGFRFTALVFTALLPPLLGARALLVLIPFALISSLGVFHVFYHYLKVPLPIGPYDYIFKTIGL